MNLELLRTTLAELSTRMGELAEPPADAGDDWQMTDEVRAEFDRTETEYQTVERQVRDLERREAALRSALDSGQAVRVGGSDVGFNVNRSGKAFGLDTIRMGETLDNLRGRAGGRPAHHGRGVRGRSSHAQPGGGQPAGPGDALPGHRR